MIKAKYKVPKSFYYFLSTEQLKGTLNLNVDEFDRLSVDDLKVQVDSAIREVSWLC